jgi:hypothetical protein
VTEDIPWRACDLGEQPWDGETPFCDHPCPGCLVVATVELNKRDPLTANPRDLADWHMIVAVTAGEIEVTL